MIHIKQQGMVLLTVLLVLGMMSLLLLSNMQSFFLYDKMTKAFETQENLLARLDNIGMEQLILWGGGGTNNCVVRNLGLNTVMDHILINGCSVGHSSDKLIYLIDDLGRFACEQIMLGTQTFGVKQGVITVVTTDAQRIGLQIRMAFAVPLTAEICHSKTMRQRLAGVMSWRLIEDYDGH